MPRQLLVYGLFFALDPTHRGLVKLRAAEIMVLSPDRSEILIAPAPRSAFRTFVIYWREGIWHIWVGVDHIVFLITLLLPLVVIGSGLAPVPLHRALQNTLVVVTAFTLAHSLTLSMAVLGFVVPPAKWIEAGIACRWLLHH